MANRVLLRGGAVLTADPDIGDLVPGDVLIEEDHIAAVEEEPRDRPVGRVERPARWSAVRDE